jgi:hypothetical protein
MPPSPKAGQLFGKAVPSLAKADRLFEKGGAVSLAIEEFTPKMPFLTWSRPRMVKKRQLTVLRRAFPPRHRCKSDAINPHFAAGSFFSNF